jgi:hypothetical protein
MVTTPNGKRKGILERIAYRVMKERGFLPDFSRAALNDLKNIQQDDWGAKSPEKDLRHLLWASIDNDDSLDPDQLTVAEALPDKTVKILVAVADVRFREGLGVKFPRATRLWNMDFFLKVIIDRHCTKV